MIPGGAGQPPVKMTRRFTAEDALRAIWIRNQMQPNSDWEQQVKERFRVEPTDEEEARAAEEEAGIKFWEENANDDTLRIRIRRAKAEVTRKNSEGVIPDDEVEDRKAEAEEAVVQEYSQSLFDEGVRLFKETAALQERAAQEAERARKRRFDAENSLSRKQITVKPDWYLGKEAEVPMSVLKKLYAIAAEGDFDKYPARRAWGLARLDLSNEKRWLAHKEEELLAHRTAALSIDGVDAAAAQDASDKTALLEVQVAEARAEVERLEDEMARAYAAKLAEEDEIVAEALKAGEDPPDFDDPSRADLWTRLERAEEELDNARFNRDGRCPKWCSSASHNRRR